MDKFISRGFPTREFEDRMQKAQRMMSKHKLDAIFLTTEANIRYFTGFFTQFWESPTRPWYLILPLNQKPIAVIPEIGFSGMDDTWIDKILTWPAPQPEDDGISLVVDTINSLPQRYGQIGITLGQESLLRMPINNYSKITRMLNTTHFVDVAMEIHHLRSIKSTLEIEKIHHACKITDEGFDKLPLHACLGNTEREICKKMRIDLLKIGADNSPYLIAASGFEGYNNIVMGPTDRIISKGDILVIDTGTVYDGYFSDFNRNFAFCYANDKTKHAHRCLYDATEAGFAAAKPNATTSDLYKAMWSALKAEGYGDNNVGRFGHGLGMQLTEWPSNTLTDNTTLVEGMVITLEPSILYSEGKTMVHEEDIVITSEGARWLSKRINKEIKIIS